MAKQLDLFSASRTTSYRNQNRAVQRRLRTTGSGDRRIARMANRVTGGQSMRANGGRIIKSLLSAKQSVRSVKKSLARSGIRVKRSSFGSKDG